MNKGCQKRRGYQFDPLAGRGSPAQLSSPAAPRIPDQLPPAGPGHPFRAHHLLGGGFAGGRVGKGLVFYLSGPFNLYFYSNCSFSFPLCSSGRARQGRAGAASRRRPQSMAVGRALPPAGRVALI